MGRKVSRAYKEQTAKALIIACGYPNSSRELFGVDEEVPEIYNVLIDIFGYTPDGIVILHDKPNEDLEHSYYAKSTRANILSEIKLLVSKSKAGDKLFLYFTGHGGRRWDKNGDEDDGYDEVILPCDHDTAGIIRDDELYELVSKIPAGVLLTGFFDSCCSGSILDLPFHCEILDKKTTRRRKTYAGSMQPKWYRNRYGVSRTREIAQLTSGLILPSAFRPRSPGDVRARYTRETFRAYERRLSHGRDEFIEEKPVYQNPIKGTIQCFSACADNKTTSCTIESIMGFLTYKFCEVVRKTWEKDPSTMTIHRVIWYLQNDRIRLTSIPQYSSSNLADVFATLEV